MCLYFENFYSTSVPIQAPLLPKHLNSVSGMQIKATSQEKGNKGFYSPLRNKSAVWKDFRFWRKDR